MFDLTATRRRVVLGALVLLAATVVQAEDGKREGTGQSLSLSFHYHLDADMYEQDVFLKRNASDSGVYRVTAGDRDMAAPLYRTAAFVPHSPYDPEQLGPYEPGEPLGITLGEWLSGTGQGEYTCADGEGRLDIRFGNLVPDGVYTLWQFFMADPPTEPFSGALALPVGARDGSQTIFRADADGNAHFEQRFRPCLQPTGEHLTAGLATAYHSDGRTYGPLPGEYATRSHIHMILMLPKRAGL
ncbi:MAG: hypothetical protein AAGE85_00430 [Pseudomonadota bacterium]